MESKKHSIKIEEQKQSNQTQTKENKKLETKRKNLLDNLNEQQQKAVTHSGSPCLILAGVGTGKTQTLMSKYCYLLLQGVKPQNILAITFTKKAAKEMIDRATNIQGDILYGHWIGTFHGMANRIIASNEHYLKLGLKKDFTVLEPRQQYGQIREILKEQHSVVNRLERLAQEQSSQDTIWVRIRKTIDKFKENNWWPDDLLNDQVQQNLTNFEKSVFAEVYNDYQERNLEENKIDFGDMVMYNNLLFDQDTDIRNGYRKQFTHILVDEFQDINKVQLKWLKNLSHHNKNVTCVGDEDQIIYQFRGATSEPILNFQKYFLHPTIVKLEQNYRSTQKIVQMANNLIRHNTQRKGKVLYSKKKQGKDVQFLDFDTDIEEYMYLCQIINDFQTKKNFQFSQIGVLTRTRYVAERIEDQFLVNAIPYYTSSKVSTFQKRKEVKKVYHYLSMLIDQSDDSIFGDILLDIYGLGDEMLIKLKSRAVAKGVSLFQLCTDLELKGQLKREASTQLEELKNETIPQIKKENVKELKQDPKSFHYIEDLNITKRVQNSIKQLVDAILKTKVPSKLTDEFLHDFLIKVGLLQHIESQRESQAMIQERKNNVLRMIDVAKNLETIEEFCEYFRILFSEQEEDKSKKVNLLTIHSSKGLEFDYVFLPRFNEGILPSAKALYFSDDGPQEEKLEEERRVAFVGFTRARKRIFITHSKNCVYNGKSNSRPSRFIRELVP